MGLEEKAGYGSPETMTKAEEPSPIGRVNHAREQLHMTVDELEKALGPVLGYDSESEIAMVEPQLTAMTFLPETAASIGSATARLRSLLRRLELN